MTVRIGIAGCGRIANFFHIPILSRLPGAELAALSDIDPDRLAEAGLGGYAKRYASAEALIASPAVEAVVLCTPPAQHAPLAVAAFAAGKHVYIEKPLALSPAEGGDVRAAWHGAGTVGMMGFNFRYHPAYLDLKRRVAAGEVGDVLAVRSSFCSARRALPDWKQAASTGGGALRDLGAHHLDLIPWLLGSPIHAIAMAERGQVTEADTALLTIELGNGIAIQTFLCASAATSENRVEVIGTGGRIVADTAFAAAGPVQRAGGRLARYRHMGRIARDNLRPRMVLAASPPEPSFAAALSAFVRAVARNDAAGAPGIPDGQQSLRAVHAAEQSARTGQRQTLAADPAS